MGRSNNRAIILHLFTVAMLLVACSGPVEGSIIKEGRINYSGDVTEIYRDGTSDSCELSEQTVTLKGEYEHEGTSFIEISRHLEKPGDCDTRAYKLLVDQMSLRLNQPLFRKQEK